MLLYTTYTLIFYNSTYLEAGLTVFLCHYIVYVQCTQPNYKKIKNRNTTYNIL